jgi:hypothetical protein
MKKNTEKRGVVGWYLIFFLGKNVEGNNHSVIWGAVQEFLWRSWGQLWTTSISLVSVPLRFEPITSLIQFEDITVCVSLFTRVLNDYDMNVYVQTMATGSPLVLVLEASQILLSSITHFLSSCFYIICYFLNCAHFSPEYGSRAFLWNIDTCLPVCMILFLKTTVWKCLKLSCRNSGLLDLIDYALLYHKRYKGESVNRSQMEVKHL